MARFLALICILVLAGCSENPFQSGSVWKGAYLCRQGWTELEFRVLERSRGMTKAVQYVFTPGAWIQQPNGYVSVGMEGEIFDDPLRFHGRIPYPSCGDFTVERMNGGY
jgi:hypothetical protein